MNRWAVGSPLWSHGSCGKDLMGYVDEMTDRCVLQAVAEGKAIVESGTFIWNNAVANAIPAQVSGAINDLPDLSLPFRLWVNLKLFAVAPPRLVTLSLKPRPAWLPRGYGTWQRRPESAPPGGLQHLATMLCRCLIKVF